MANRYRNSFWLCPCCGSESELEISGICCSCGARRVGEPLEPPEILLPSLGPSLTALAVALAIILLFTIFWLLGNDMKVLRSLLVWALGDGLKFTRGLLEADPDLPYYRIFSYDAYRLAFYLSAGLIPLSGIALWLGHRAWRLVRSEPGRFGGLRCAQLSFALSLGLFVTFTAVTISSIPRALEQGRAKKAAATRATLYQLQYLLKVYYRQYGTYPPELSWLQRVSKEPIPRLDYWEQAISYSTASVIASKNTPPGFSNYQLVSAGPDGVFDTPDDIVMRDDVIVNAPVVKDLPTSLLAPEKSSK